MNLPQTRLANAETATATHTTSASSLYSPDLRFQRDWPGIGTLALRPLDPAGDIDTVFDWVSRDSARFWGMNGDSRDQVTAFYRDMAQSDSAQAFLGLHDGQPAFLVECYDPRHDPVGEHYAVQPGDRGMHFLVAPLATSQAPAASPIHGFSQAVIDTVVAFLFSDPGTQRIVVEPDVNNEKIHPLNHRTGFVYEGEIRLAEKTAHLGFCTRERFESLNASRRPDTARDEAVAHLRPDRWQRANRDLLGKAISEFAHEQLLAPLAESRPEVDGWADYRLTTNSDSIVYRFRARRMALDHWWIDTGTLAKTRNGDPQSLDVAQFLLEFRDRLGIDPDNLPTYLEEIASTLAGMAYKLGRDVPPAGELALADFQTVETAMSEGHPCFVANSGRIGFDVEDYHRYAPEAGAAIRPVWLAAARHCTTYGAIDGLDFESLIEDELDTSVRERFVARLHALGLDPDDYVFMPVHPWQWRHKLAITFAGEVAEQRLVLLGEADDDYRAQQSIRTWFNVSRPRRRYVKFALSILNMGFMRGLSPHYMKGTPAINAWVENLVASDPELQAQGFSVLREVATLGYHHADFEAATDKQHPYQKMLACLWRESPYTRIAPNRRLMTMAALLHRDASGDALLPALIDASGIGARNWIERYLAAYMTPLLHCFFAHDLVFMPHGENLILQLKNHVPTGAILKDIGEETGIFDNGQSLPEAARRIAVEVPEELKILSIFTDLFDCFFRFLAEILVASNQLEENEFWQLVAACVIDYQQRHPELADKFEHFDLFAPEFTLSCLNRLQLRNNRQMIDLADPSKNLQFAGTLVNPIAAYRRLSPGV